MLVALRASVTYRSTSAFAACAHVVSFMLALTVRLHADDAADVKRQLELLHQQNAALQQQVRQQQAVIETLSRRVEGIERKSALSNRESEDNSEAGNNDVLRKVAKGFNLGRVNISGEAAVAFFDTQANGTNPNAEF